MSLDHILQRLHSVDTSGEWSFEGGPEGAYSVSSPNGPITWDDHSGYVFRAGDAQFIASAPSDVRKLIDAIHEIVGSLPDDAAREKAWSIVDEVLDGD